MIPTDFYVEPADWRVDKDAIVAVRTEVFIEEQQVPEDEEFDADDETARHFLACRNDQTPIGTARLTVDGRIGRMAVVSEARGEGVGLALLRACVDVARLRGDRRITLAAQCHAIPFYAREGFKPYGEEFDDVGIPHRWMALDLDGEPLIGARSPERRQAADPALLPDGFVTGLEDFCAASLQLIACCERRLDIYTHDLDALCLNRSEHVEALSRLLANAFQPQIRILVINSDRAVNAGHRWLGLAKVRVSAIGVRNPRPDDATDPRTYMIADRRHVLVRPLASRWDAESHPDSPHLAERLLEGFDDAWECATPDPEIRRLDL